LTDRQFRERDRANLMKALQRTNGLIYGEGGAAELLGVNPTTLAPWLRAFRITPRPRESQCSRDKAKDATQRR
jgi:transcriptional regulator with GAF, ATPase, and Fis domain